MLNRQPLHSLEIFASYLPLVHKAQQEIQFAIGPPMTPLTPRAPRRFATVRTSVALMLREMVTTYGRSPGGYIWAVVEPVAAATALRAVRDELTSGGGPPIRGTGRDPRC